MAVVALAHAGDASGVGQGRGSEDALTACYVDRAYCLDAHGRIAEVPITETCCIFIAEPFLEKRCANPECGETTRNDTLCRDCGIEEYIAKLACPECGHTIWRLDIYPASESPHADGCSKRVPSPGQVDFAHRPPPA